MRYAGDMPEMKCVGTTTIDQVRVMAGGAETAPPLFLVNRNIPGRIMSTPFRRGDPMTVLADNIHRTIWPLHQIPRLIPRFINPMIRHLDGIHDGRAQSFRDFDCIDGSHFPRLLYAVCEIISLACQCPTPDLRFQTTRPMVANATDFRPSLPYHIWWPLSTANRVSHQNKPLNRDGTRRGRISPATNLSR